MPQQTSHEPYSEQPIQHNQKQLLIHQSSRKRVSSLAIIQSPRMVKLQARPKKRRIKPSRRAKHALVDAASIAAIGAVHPAGTGSLDAGPSSQRALELQHGARDLVAHGRLALVVVHRGSSGAVADAVVARRLGRGCGGRGSVRRAARVGAVGCSAPAEKARLEARARRRAGCPCAVGGCRARGSRAGRAAGHEGHFGLIGWLVEVVGLLV